MPNNASDRERLLKLIDGAPETLKEISLRPVEAPVTKPQTPAFTWKARAARVYEKVRAAVTVPATDRGFPMKTALVFLAGVLAVVYLFSFFSGARNSADNAPAAAALGEVPAEKVEALGLRLVGVDWGEQPVALIEDTRTGKTYFVRRNDSVKDARVKQILRNKVVLGYRNSSVVLQ